LDKLKNLTMKKTILFLASALLVSLASTASGSLYSNLVIVNSQWQKQNDIPAYVMEQAVCENKTYTQWIATHLMLVEQTLRARNTAGLTPSQKQNRLQRLDELKEYWKAGNFPVNDYKGYKTPVFIDCKGTHCAVGQLMMTSGSDALAQQIDREQKFAFVHEIKVQGVNEWADKNGFSVDELAWIQPQYWPEIECYDDVFYIGNNTPTVCAIFKNDLISAGQCGISPYPLNVTITRQPTHGTASINGNYEIQYQPFSSYIGKDSLVYSVFSQPGGCIASSDTAKVIFNVLPQSGTFLSFAPGDADFNSALTNSDVLSLVRNLGETGAVRQLNLPSCEVTYSVPWGTTFNGNDIAPNDGDGNGQVEVSDLAHIVNCFSGSKPPMTVFSHNNLYKIKLMDYDTLLAPGKSVDVKFTVVDSNGTVIPLKAITFVTIPRTNSVSFLNSNLICSAVRGSTPGSIETHYEAILTGYFPQQYMGAFAYRGQSNPVKDVSVASDTFRITTSPISADSIFYDGISYIGLNEIWAMDMNDSIFLVDYDYIRFRTTSVSGIENTQINGVSVFPDPATTELTLNLGGRQTDRVRTFSLDGRLVSDINEPANNRLDIQNLVKGIYITEITLQGATQRVKWVKM
jgi:hypothetical protein